MRSMWTRSWRRSRCPQVRPRQGGMAMHRWHTVVRHVDVTRLGDPGHPKLRQRAISGSKSGHVVFLQNRHKPCAPDIASERETLVWTRAGGLDLDRSPDWATSIGGSIGPSGQDKITSSLRRVRGRVLDVALLEHEGAEATDLPAEALPGAKAHGKRTTLLIDACRRSTSPARLASRASARVPLSQKPVSLRATMP